MRLGIALWCDLKHASSTAQIHQLLRYCLCGRCEQLQANMPSRVKTGGELWIMVPHWARNLECWSSLLRKFAVSWKKKVCFWVWRDQLLGALAALPEAPGSVLSTYMLLMIVWNSNLKRSDAFFWLPCVSGTHMWVLLALSTESSRIVRATTQRNRISEKQKYRVDGTWETAPKSILSSTCTHLHEQIHMKTCPPPHRKYRLTFRIFKRGKLNIYKNTLLIFFQNFMHI